MATKKGTSTPKRTAPAKAPRKAAPVPARKGTVPVRVPVKTPGVVPTKTSR